MAGPLGGADGDLRVHNDIKYSSNVGNNDMQAYNKKGSTSGLIVENSTYT
jgi:hypothetical protein